MSVQQRAFPPKKKGDREAAFPFKVIRLFLLQVTLKEPGIYRHVSPVRDFQNLHGGLVNHDGCSWILSEEAPHESAIISNDRRCDVVLSLPERTEVQSGCVVVIVLEHHVVDVDVFDQKSIVSCVNGGDPSGAVTSPAVGRD